MLISFEQIRMRLSVQTHHLSLGDQLTRVELRSDRFQDLIDDGGQDTLIVVGSKLSVTAEIVS